ncbi:MAG TPA: hypothetical protein VFG68_00310 [Fimbriiglobus sp.]|nr:hypothetical protein [Fimbriiglobus sp.]
MRHRYVVYGGLVSAAFAFGYGYGTPSAAAAAGQGPAACPKYECKTIHGWWPPAQNFVYGFFIPGSNGHNNSDTAQLDIFTPNSVEKNPTVGNNNVDWFKYTACTPQCGLDPGNNKWQNPAEVIILAVGGTMDAANKPRQQCTGTGGGEGPRSADQTNPNSEGRTPPGWEG